MKTAVSLPDDLFRSADALAAELGVSRSRLYAAAVEDYVARHRSEHVTSILNQVYREQPSGLAPDLRHAQGRRSGAAKSGGPT